MRITLDIPDEAAMNIHCSYDKASRACMGKDENARLVWLKLGQAYLCSIRPEIWHAINQEIRRKQNEA